MPYPDGTPGSRRQVVYVECVNCGASFETPGVWELGAWTADPCECPRCGLDPFADERPLCPKCEEDDAEWDDGWVCPRHGPFDSGGPP